ncbi:MAG: P83/100 family protein, partial [Alkalispirochaeta sp.]
MRNRRLFGPLVVLIVFTCSSALGALELDREEIEGASDIDIEFENYEGPVDEIDSRDAIRGIGRILGEGIANADRSNYDDRYLLQRIIGDVEDTRLAADILELTDDSRVDHIENLRRIISGYLEASWEYERDDANLLARFITIYNAVNRGSLSTFSERYRSAVSEALDEDRAGLATSFRRWAGQTQLVIPIRDDRAPGALDAVDPRQLVDARVIEELRTRRDLGIEDRKAIIDFIERVIEERTAAIQEERDDLDQEQEAIDERQEELDEREPESDDQDDEETAEPPADEDDADAEEDDEDDADEPDEEEPSQDADDEAADDGDGEEPDAEPDDAPDRSDEAEESDEPDGEDSEGDERQDLEDREREITERQEELDEEEEELEELTERVEELYDETAEDQASLEESSDPSDMVAFVLGDESGGLELAVVDFGDAVVAGEQTIPVANRELIEFQGNIVVAHQTSGRLLLLDPSSLSVISESDVPVVPGSRIRVVDGYLLTVMPEEGAFVVGEFDAQLVLQRRSARPVLENTDIVARDDEVLVQGEEDGALRVLRLDE